MFRSGWGAFLTNVQQGVWSQWAVKFSNRGDEARLVRVGCPTAEPSGAQTLFSRVVSLPPGCSREVSLAFRPGEPQIPPTGRDAEQKYILWDAQIGRQVQVSTGILTYAPAGVNFIGVLQGDRIEHDENSYLKSGLLRSLLGEVKVVSASRGSLPDCWYGYSPLKMFVLGNVETAEFRATQIEALLRWVRAGGYLLITGGENTPDLLAGPIGRAAGVRAVGVHFTDALRVRNLSKPSEEPISVSLPWPLPAVELYATDAEVLYEANDLSLLTLRRLGEGCVLVSAVPVGALKPQGDFNLWPDVARTLAVRPALEAEAFLAPGRETLQQIAGRRGPDRIVPMTVLAVLLGIVLVAGSLLRRARRGEWLWGLLVPLGLVVGLGLFFYNLRQGDPQRLSHVGLMTGLGDGQTRLQQAFAYFSGPEAQTLSPASGSPAGLISDLGRSTAAALKLAEIRTTADGTELPDQNVEPNDTRIFHTLAVTPTSVLSGSLQFNEAGLGGELTNNLPDDIEDAVLLVNFHTYRVGSIPAGESRRVQIGDDDLLGLVSFPPPPGSRGVTAAGAKPPAEPPTAEGEFSSAIAPNKLQTALVRRLIAQPGFQNGVAGGTRLIGYTSSAGVDPLAGRNLQRQGWSVVNWPISFLPPRAGQRVHIPAGWVNMNIRAMNWDTRRHSFLEVSRDAKIPFTVELPAGVRLGDLVAEIVIDARASDYRLSVLGIPPGEAQPAVPLGAFDRPNGEVRLRVPEAERFLDARGRLAFQLDVARATMDLPDLRAGRVQTRSISPSAAGAPWKLQRVDVSLKGTVR